MTPQSLSADLAARFAGIALGHVRREYPNNLDHALSGPRDARTPSDLHPIFYGSYDWHSCVHSYWMLARLLRRFPSLALAANIRSLFDEQFVPEKVAAECAYLAAPTARGFKRPYGWAGFSNSRKNWRCTTIAAGRRHFLPWRRSLPSGSAISCRSRPIPFGSAPIQHRLRAQDGGRLRGRNKRCRAERPIARYRTPLVLR
jgi:Protein of unknown function (DUF2891)